MKTFLFILMLAPMLVGCESLKRITEGPSSEPGPDLSVPNEYVVTGVTITDFQIIQPVRCAGSTVTVKVKRSGEDWQVCNKYEAKIDPVGVGGGGVWFKKICYPTYDPNGNLIKLVITSRPVAPAGTEYEIRSVLN